jgi:hypothetical protein
VQAVDFSFKRPTAEELKAAHEKYTRTVPNGYLAAIQRVFAALSTSNAEELATAVAEWLLDINRQNYRFHPEEGRRLSVDSGRLCKERSSHSSNFVRGL